MDQPTKSVPGGCVIGFFGLLCWVATGISGYGIWVALNNDHLENKAAIIKKLSMVGGVTFLIGFLLLYWWWKLAIKVGAYDEWDPKEPRIKF